MNTYNHYLNNYLNMQEFEGLYDNTFQKKVKGEV